MRNLLDCQIEDFKSHWQDFLARRVAVGDRAAITEFLLAVRGLHAPQLPDKGAGDYVSQLKHACEEAGLVVHDDDETCPLSDYEDEELTEEIEGRDLLVVKKQDAWLYA